MTIYYRTNKNGLPYLRKADIEAISKHYISKFNANLLKEAQPTPIEELIENYFKLEMDYLDITKNKNILGLTTFDDGYIIVYNLENHKYKNVYEVKGTIVVDNLLLKNEQEGRFRFTLGHELSHWILHRTMFELNKQKSDVTAVKCLSRSLDNFSADKRPVTSIEKMEWQANYMSACLLLPMQTFTKITKKMFKEAGIKSDSLVVGEDNDLDMFSEYLPIKLADIFNVSARAASVRLRELKLITHIKHAEAMLIMFVIVHLSTIFLGNLGIFDLLGNFVFS